MESKISVDKNRIASHISVARFELNRTQTSLILITSLIGVIILPFLIAGNIFFNLFQFIFFTLPLYLVESHFYHEDYLIYNLTPIITGLILEILFFSLSIYGLKRTLKQKNPDKQPQRKIIPLNRRVNWFGLKLSHGQSIFIFCISLIGILYIIPELIILYIYPDPAFGLLESLCIIPTGPHSGIGHQLLSINVPRAILITFIIFCLFSLFISRRGKPISSSTKIIKNYSLLIFIFSFIVLIFTSARIFCHLALFNDFVSNLLGMSAEPLNPYQNSDFIRTSIFLIISLSLMITSFFLTGHPYEERNPRDELTWLHIKLTPQRGIILLSLALFFLIFLFIMFLPFILFMSLFNFIVSPMSIIFDVLPAIPIIFCYYPIGKLMKAGQLDKFIEKIEDSNEFEATWLNIHLDKLNSIIFFSVSCGLIIFYMFQLVLINMNASIMLNYSFSYDEYLLYSFPLMTVIIGAFLIMNVYTIRKTLPSIKSPKKLR
ncbi:MAG: hypothetical protein ACFFC1_19345 [Promethearchaeota archaeon]